MGSCVSNSNNTKKNNIIILGLEGAGKTTILYQLTKNKRVPAIPTVGKNEETFNYKKKKYNMIDFGGKQKSLNYFNQYFQNTLGIIFVIDGNNKEQFEQSYIYFKQIFQEQSLKGIPILILLNKKDLKVNNEEQNLDGLNISNNQNQFNNQTENNIKQIFKLQHLQSCLWKIQEVSGNTREGLLEGFQWLYENMYTIHKIRN
ncbi:P-loop containing nucleoside triphosphate hydrolase [Pseudocohnilembus persalinus]|uniref:p-loop containing nucleoside triphosphate hydrolase n=1 Tax=Pseudocohnilembus persalinus TaxID=266149 RepID=A0A0V0QP23_PSEPJ|nr:P-loop containing nucleoside triphosphate hydrolase [Pseudocohnilembus persalinus]|eukprot:KRX03940.1 P-loop containing nucleoside triphosphate hydrolase [Pseudocohnilembus persalinus]